MLLNAVDILQQQGEVTGRGLDETNQTLEEVVTQTKLTNGTVKNHEGRIAANEGILREFQKAAARRTKIMTTAIPLVVVGLEIVAKKAGLL